MRYLSVVDKEQKGQDSVGKVASTDILSLVKFIFDCVQRNSPKMISSRSSSIWLADINSVCPDNGDDLYHFAFYFLECPN